MDENLNEIQSVDIKLYTKTHKNPINIDFGIPTHVRAKKNSLRFKWLPVV